MLYQRDFVFNVGAASVNKSSTLARRVAWDPGGPRATNVIAATVGGVVVSRPSVTISSLIDSSVETQDSRAKDGGGGGGEVR